MSEPLSSSDIEDVVSSVRRLVSPEARPRAVSRDLGLDRLILTPSFRITADQSGSGASVVKLETVAKKSRASMKRMKTRMIASVIVGDDGAEVLPPLPNPQTTGDADTGTMTSLDEAVLSAEDAVVIVADPVADQAGSAPQKASNVKAKRKAAGEKNLTPVKAKTVRTAKKAVAEPKATTTRKRRSASSAAPKPVAEPSVAAIEAAVAGLAAMSQSTAPPEVEIETAIGAVPDQVPLAEDEAAAVVIAGQDDLAAAPEEHRAAGTGPALTDAEGNPISILDEEQLILLLRRVIREELQGSLGEKITRSVRKLVRAEINRALTADTLE